MPSQTPASSAKAALNRTQPASFLAQLRLFLAQGVRAELADKERFLSPLLFAATLLILFTFAMGDVEPELAVRLFLAETFLTGLFALQLSFARTFEPDEKDRVFDTLRSYPISAGAWYLGKYLLVVLMGGLILCPTMALAALLQGQKNLTLLTPGVFGVAILALAGLAALGVLLSAMTLKATARQILYPLLYFPLTTPVLLAATQASHELLQGSLGPVSMLSSWLGLLGGFDVIYFTLGFLLFGVLVEPA